MNLYKHIVIALIIAIFAGCSAPKPQTKPLWFTNPPKDFKCYYEVGEANSLSKAKNIAVFALRNKLNKELNNNFASADHPLSHINTQRKSEILAQNEHLSKTLPMHGLRIINSEVYKGKTLVLICLPKKELFEYLQKRSKEKFENAKRSFSNAQNLIAIKKFIAVKPLLKNYASIASFAQLKQNTLSTYSASAEFRYLKDLNDTYEKLKKSISFYVVGDANSRIFTQVIKQSIKEEGLTISKIPVSSNSLKLIVSSRTTNSQDYSFNKSSSLVQFTTYDMQKRKIAFKQHTFVGKSRKSYADAKEQAALHMYAKAKKFGVFQFLGL